MPEPELAGDDSSRGGIVNIFLNVIEKAGNRLPDPVTIFLMLAVLTLVASAVASATGLQVYDPVKNETITVFNLLSKDGVRKVVAGIVPNFTGFAPLGTVLVAMIGIGVAERTGLFNALLKGIVLSVPRSAITPTIIFVGCISNVAADSGFVILPPLAALLYASMGRHPLAGLTAAFAGVGGGFSANIFISALDPMLSGLSQEAARLVDPSYEVFPTANFYFLFASTFLVTIVGTWVSVKIVEPRLGPWKGDASDNSFEQLEPREKRGLIWAAIATVATLVAILLLVLPQNGPMRDPDTGSVMPFFRHIIGLLMILFLVPGLAFGLATRRIRTDRDAARMMGDTMSVMGSYIVMAFFAGQFIAYFNQSNLGAIIAIKGALFLQDIHFKGTPLLVAFVFLAAAINLLMASSSAKWAIMAPVFVPMMMRLGISPQATQAFYRVGDSVTNVITPLNYYFPIIIAVAQKYVPRAGLGTVIASMLPFSVAFAIAWTVFIVIWSTLGLPLGPDAPLTYALPAVMP